LLGWADIVKVKGQARLQTVVFDGFAARNSNPAGAGGEVREKQWVLEI